MTAVWWSPRPGTWTTPPRSSEVRPPLPAAECWAWDGVSALQCQACGSDKAAPSPPSAQCRAPSLRPSLSDGSRGHTHPCSTPPPARPPARLPVSHRAFFVCDWVFWGGTGEEKRISQTPGGPGSEPFSVRSVIALDLMGSRPSCPAVPSALCFPDDSCPRALVEPRPGSAESPGQVPSLSAPWPPWSWSEGSSAPPRRPQGQ